MAKLTHCPMCGARVHRTHRCTARPMHPNELEPMPGTFRLLLAQALEDAQAPRLDPLPPFRDGEGG